MFDVSHARLSKTKKISIRFLVSDLLPYLPHRDPMVWVEEVLEIGEESGRFYGTCRTSLKSPSLFFDGKGLKGSAAIELCAQAYGFAKACFHHVNDIDDTPSVTYLTGVKKCETFFEGLEDNELITEVYTTRRMPNLTFIAGTVRGAQSGKVYATTEIQVYTA